jgi:DNA-binding protein HU-beta
LSCLEQYSIRQSSARGACLSLLLSKHQNKTALIKRVAQKNQKQQITKRVYNQVLKDLLTGIQSELAAGRKVQFLGFGTFYTRIHKGGRGMNFKTNKPVEYKAVRLPAFRPGSLLKRAVRKKK